MLNRIVAASICSVASLCAIAPASVVASTLELHDCASISRISREIGSAENLDLIVTLQDQTINEHGLAHEALLAEVNGQTIAGEPFGTRQILFRSISAGSWKFCPHQGANFSASLVPTKNPINRAEGDNASAVNGSVIFAGVIGATGLGVAAFNSGGSSSDIGHSSDSNTLNSVLADNSFDSVPSTEVTAGSRTPGDISDAERDDCFNDLRPNPVSPFL